MPFPKEPDGRRKGAFPGTSASRLRACIAAVVAKQAGKQSVIANPVLLYVGKDRGHGHGMTVPEKVQEYRDKWTFLKSQMK